MHAARRIISASRRTDIPAHYAQWLMQRVDVGWCEYRHPYTRELHRVSLQPSDVAGLVLWSKDYGPLLPHLHTLSERYTVYCHFTITGHPSTLEPGAPSVDCAVKQAQQIATLLGREALVWRFDPIVHTQLGGPESTLERFKRLVERLEGLTEECVISFMSPYRRQRRAFEERGLVADEPSPEERLDLAQTLAEAARARGMGLSACCNPELTAGGIARATCIDARLLRRLGADLPDAWPAGPSREGCGCHRCTDIGAYDTCITGCAYCYANQRHAQAAANHESHDASAPALGAEPRVEPKSE